ncbi:MAG: head GIN domain-containing protein [Chitinophagales bacterium]
MKHLFFLAIAIISIAMVSCTKQIVGEGPIITQTLDIDDFSKLTLDSSFDVYIEQGSEQTVVAEGHENIINKLNVAVSNNTLTAELSEGSYTNIQLKLFITTPLLSEIKNDGSGDIEIASMNVDNLLIDLQGSGNVVINNEMGIAQQLQLESDGSGNIKIEALNTNDLVAKLKGSGDVKIENGLVNELDLLVDGSGDAKLFGLETANCMVTSDGSGDTEINVTDNLDIQIMGSGDVSYMGNPTINITDDGSGDLIDAN